MSDGNTQLAASFKPLEWYQEGQYALLPFKFIHLSDSRYLITNIAGEYFVLTRTELEQLVERGLSRADPQYTELKAKHFIYDGDPSLSLEVLSAQYRTRNAYLADFTALHIFVVTLRCDHSCQYCQVSRVSADRGAYDMTQVTALRAIDLMFQSPSPYLKVEFQGGEALLNFELIRFIVGEVERRASTQTIEFVIASNLAFLSDEILDFAKEHRIQFSCSLDGPALLHDLNRPRPERDSYERTIRSIRRIREKLGPDAVSALMTTTAESLEKPVAIVDEYVRQGFHSIFLRWISPFGFAVKSTSRIGYDTERFLAFYKRGLEHILKLNGAGTFLREEYASIILHKILTPYSSGYVDLQSPAGLGLSVVVYNYDGMVYASDEARMLAEMGDHSFLLGNLHENTYRQLFLDSPLLSILFETMTEGLPGCSECALSPYCGTDPVYNHATQGNLIGHRPTSSFCRRNMEIIRHLIGILEEKSERSQILRRWVA